MVNKINKKAQVTVWVIVAAVFVATIILFLFLRGKFDIKIGGASEFNAQYFLDQCIRTDAEKIMDKMLLQGGFYEPADYKLYKDEKIAYACKTESYYSKCINQHPMLLTEIHDDYYNKVKPLVDNCVIQLKNAAERRGYKFAKEGDGEIKIEILPGRILIELNNLIIIEKNDVIQRYDKFRFVSFHPAYDLISVANDITNYEANYCYFEYVGYMLLYPNIDIRKTALSDPTKIYTIMDKKSGIKMNIATRSCAIPAGI